MRTASILTASAIVGTALAVSLPQDVNKDRVYKWDDDDNDTPLPVVIWHGLGDSSNADGLAQVAELLDSVNPGTFVHIVNPNPDNSDDRSATFFGNVTEQVQNVCEQLKHNPILSTAPAVDAIGFSQGGQFLRGYIERCNFPPVRNLITFGSQHNGITEFRECGNSEWLCKAAMGLLRFNVWSGFVQNRVVPAQYYRNTDEKEYQSYLESSNFLADINNERELKNEQYKENLASLQNLVMYMFENDTVAIPKESAWFGQVEGEEYTPLHNRTLYKEDWIGLKALDKKGSLSFRTTPGQHMEITDKVITKVAKEFFGPYKKKSANYGYEEVFEEL